jgi:hypothetical protein
MRHHVKMPHLIANLKQIFVLVYKNNNARNVKSSLFTDLKINMDIL